ncbi:MAG: cyclase family protein [Anaerolineae bacterium]|nr:cyclase family protein [Anaerolineae bacterium]
MRTYDVTLTITPDLVVWPEDPPVDIQRVSKIEEGAAANVTRINISVHTGTHIDAPFHFLEDGGTVEDISIDLLTGRSYVLHLPEADSITKDMVENSSIPPRTKRVLFRTKNSEIWAKKKFDGAFKKDYVALEADAAEYLIKRGVKLVGVDYLSVAPFTDLVATHEVLLSAGVVIVEGLDLSEVDQGRYSLYCLPLKIAGSDGAPARVILTGV